MTKAIDNYGIDLARQLGFVPVNESSLINSSAPVIVNVIDCAISSKFHGLHWETLEAALTASGLQSIVTHSATISAFNPTPFGGSLSSSSRSGLDQTPLTRKRSFNILLVVSRPFKSYDVNPLLGVEALLAARDVANGSNDDSDVKIDIEISRPGTWHAFTSLLEKRTSDWNLSGGQGPWYNIVHFDCHRVVRDGKPGLLFLSRNGIKALRKSAQEIAKCLTDHFVRFVVLHACNSAEVNATGTSNLARLLLESGLSAVIGMKYAFNSSAARIFVKTLYSTLFASPRFDMTTVIGYARAALRSDTVRLSGTDTAVDLADFIIPVLYCRDTTIVRNEIIHSTREGRDVRSSETRPVEGIDGLVTPIGREQDVIELEWLLLRSAAHKVAALTGCVGVGKTSLAIFVGQWWTATGSVAKVHYWDLKRYSLPTCLDVLTPSLSSDAQASPRRPDLLILDHIDAVLHQSSVFQDLLSESDRSNLHEWIHSRSGEHLRILLVSRSQQDWFGLPKAQRYLLKGLTDHDAYKYAMQQMDVVMGKPRPIGRPTFLEMNTDYVGYLMTRLNHNPLSITTFLDAIGTNR